MEFGKDDLKTGHESHIRAAEDITDKLEAMQVELE